MQKHFSRKESNLNTNLATLAIIIYHFMISYKLFTNALSLINIQCVDFL